jgi:hypothetical protein
VTAGSDAGDERNGERRLDPRPTGVREMCAVGAMGAAREDAGQDKVVDLFSRAVERIRLARLGEFLGFHAVR